MRRRSKKDRKGLYEEEKKEGRNRKRLLDRSLETGNLCGQWLKKSEEEELRNLKVKKNW